MKNKKKSSVDKNFKTRKLKMSVGGADLTEIEIFTLLTTIPLFIVLALFISGRQSAKKVEVTTVPNHESNVGDSLEGCLSKMCNLSADKR